MTQSDSAPPIRVRQPRTWGEFFQGCAYGALGLWSIVFWLYPPTAFVSALDASTRIFWLLVVLVGCIFALIGLIIRWDLKVELPGVMFAMFGPLAYSLSQVYYILFPTAPPPGVPVGRPQDRYALAVYAMVPVFLLLVRMWQLIAQANLAKRSRRTADQASRQLIETGSVRIDTGPLTLIATDRNYEGKRPAHDILRDAENLLHGGDDR